MTKGGLMSKLVIGLAAFILLAAGRALAGNALTDSSPGVTTTATTPPGTTTNDDTTTSTSTLETGEDVSGPCDEAEHANDPRCTGAAPAGEREDPADDDWGGGDRAHTNRGPGGGDHGDDDHGEDDGSGSNRGSDDNAIDHKRRSTECERRWQSSSARSWPRRPSRSRRWARPPARRSASARSTAASRSRRGRSPEP